MIAMTTIEMLQWLAQLSACYPNSEKVKAVRARLAEQHEAIKNAVEFYEFFGFSSAELERLAAL